MTNTTWRTQHSVETSATTDAIWRLFADVNGWKAWNPGIARIELHGPFASGSAFSMQPPGQDAMTSVLVEVTPGMAFVDETRVGDLLVRVAHRIEALNNERRRIIYEVEAIGPGSSEIGPAVSADFPDVLAALAAAAESTS